MDNRRLKQFSRETNTLNLVSYVHLSIFVLVAAREWFLYRYDVQYDATTFDRKRCSFARKPNRKISEPLKMSLAESYARQAAPMPRHACIYKALKCTYCTVPVFRWTNLDSAGQTGQRTHAYQITVNNGPRRTLFLRPKEVPQWSKRSRH